MMFHSLQSFEPVSRAQTPISGFKDKRSTASFEALRLEDFCFLQAARPGNGAPVSRPASSSR